MGDDFRSRAGAAARLHSAQDQARADYARREAQAQVDRVKRADEALSSTIEMLRDARVSPVRAHQDCATEVMRHREDVVRSSSFRWAAAPAGGPLVWVLDGFAPTDVGMWGVDDQTRRLVSIHQVREVTGKLRLKFWGYRDRYELTQDLDSRYGVGVCTCESSEQRMPREYDEGAQTQLDVANELATWVARKGLV